MNATVRKIGGNLQTVTGKVNGVTRTVLVSYETPVAVAHCGDQRVYVTTTRWSRSTDAQVRDWAYRLVHELGFIEAVDTDQAVIDTALRDLIGDTRLRNGKTSAARLGRTVDTTTVDYQAHTGHGDKALVIKPRRYAR